MLRVAIPRNSQKLENLFSTFPAKIMVVTEELLPDLVHSSKVDIAFVPYSKQLEHKFSHRIIRKNHDWLIIQSENISAENRILLDEFILRITAAIKAENRYMLRFVAALSDEKRLNKLFEDAFVTDVFVVRNDTLVRFEATIEKVAFYDILNSLHDAGARQISLIPLEQYY